MYSYFLLKTMPENQEIKAPIEANKEVSVSKESATPDSFSSIKNNLLFQEQLNTYKTEHPEIEKNITNYLQKDQEKTERIKTQLNNPNLDENKKIKIINMIIDNCIKETPVFPKQENSNNQNIQEIDTKKIEQKQVVNTEEQKTIEMTESLKQRFQEVEATQNTLIKNNSGLSTKIDEISKKLKTDEKTIKTIKGLEAKGLSAENIDKFISFKATQEAIKADPSIQNTESFLLSFKKLENELNIPDSSREDFSSQEIIKTSTQLFNPEIGNQNLIDTVSEQKKIHAGDFEKLFDEPKDIDALNDVYGKFLPESQKTYKIIQDKQENKTKLSQEDEAFLKTFKTDLEIKKTEFESKTTESMEQSTILGPIMGLANYMDMGIGNTFEFNKSNDIQIENGTLSITGNIDNKPFTLETNLDKPSKLKTSDYLNKSDDSNM
jgi:hypothetical protein